jgi:SAM-dependent methyltransferase
MSQDLRDAVKEHYAEAAIRVLGKDSGATGAETATSGCGCGPSCCGGGERIDPITKDLYDEVTTEGLPEAAVLASLGCGNPTALAELHEGEVVLDLGSGGGIDVLLSARRVGPTGKAYGLDMTDEMLELARQNAAEVGATNVEFLRGHIEEIPLPANTVDVIISNCVINLSSDKRKVLAEAFRVLKPGGRFAVSDVLTRGEIPADVRRSVEMWVGCLAGALDAQEFLGLLREVGFENASIEPTRIYEVEQARSFLEDAGMDVDALAAQVDGRFMAAFVRATKPAGALAGAGAGASAESARRASPLATRAGRTCCGPDCC